MPRPKETRSEYSIIIARIIILSFPVISFIAFVVASIYLLSRKEFETTAISRRTAKLSFKTELISVDPISRTLVMEWSMTTPRSCNSTTLTDVYMDPSYLDNPGLSSSDVVAYRINNTGICDGRQSTQIGFKTIAKLIPAIHRGGARAAIQQYPFDVYFAKAEIYAKENDTGGDIPVNITSFSGWAANFDVSVDSAFTKYNPQSRYYISLLVKRSSAVKMFVLIISFANWLIAIAFLLVSISTMVYPKQDLYSEIFMLPIGALFACTALRANLPGAPSDFGATIDFYTILPVLLILALCSAYLLLIILYRRVKYEYADSRHHQRTRNSNGNHTGVQTVTDHELVMDNSTHYGIMRTAH